MSPVNSGALAGFGLHPDPMGTPDELRRAGMDVGAVGSCAPGPGMEGHQKGVRGCRVYDRCIFRWKKNGGFRDHGPENVPYYLNDGTAMETYAPCFVFIATLLDRMRAGQRDIEDGKAGELIEILPFDQPITRRMVCKVDENDRSQTARWETRIEQIVVPKFPRPGKTDMTGNYEAMLEQRRRARAAANPDLQEAQKHRVSSDATPEGESDTWDMDEGSSASDEHAVVGADVPARKARR